VFDNSLMFYVYRSIIEVSTFAYVTYILGCSHPVPLVNLWLNFWSGFIIRSMAVNALCGSCLKLLCWIKF